MVRQLLLNVSKNNFKPSDYGRQQQHVKYWNATEQLIIFFYTYNSSVTFLMIVLRLVVNDEQTKHAAVQLSFTAITLFFFLWFN